MPAKMSELAQNIEKWRKNRGIVSRVALSKKAGLGESAVNDIVQNADRSPRISSIEAIANALQVPITYLIPSAGEAATGDGLQAVDGSEIVRRGRKTKTGINLLAERNEPGTEFYTVESTEFSSFGYAKGDLISVDSISQPQTGNVVAVALSGRGDVERVTLRYFAEPLLFGFSPDHTPTHEYTASPDVRIIGRVTASVRLCPD